MNFEERLRKELTGIILIEDCDRFIKICEEEFLGAPIEDPVIYQIKEGLSYMKSLYEEAAKKSFKNVEINMDLEP